MKCEAWQVLKHFVSSFVSIFKESLTEAILCLNNIEWRGTIKYHHECTENINFWDSQMHKKVLRNERIRLQESLKMFYSVRNIFWPSDSIPRLCKDTKIMAVRSLKNPALIFEQTPTSSAFLTNFWVTSPLKTFSGWQGDTYFKHRLRF